MTIPHRTSVLVHALPGPRNNHQVREDERGFSLVEVLVAAGLLAGALGVVAQLFGLAMRGNLDARHTTYATVLAQQKVEELRSVSWESERVGVDYVDRFGNTLGQGDTPPPNALYARQWSMEALTGDPDRALVIQVRVTRVSSRARQTGRLRDESRLVTLKTREAP